jgi:hypothetical protein
MQRCSSHFAASSRIDDTLAMSAAVASRTSIANDTVPGFSPTPILLRVSRDTNPSFVLGGGPECWLLASTQRVADSFGTSS